MGSEALAATELFSLEREDSTAPPEIIPLVRCVALCLYHFEGNAIVFPQVVC